MKKTVILLYFIFIVFVNVALLGYGDTFVSYFDLLFLNSEQFATYQLEVFNFQYIISFFLLLLLMLYRLLSDRNEIASYLYMILYRKGVKQTLSDMQKKACKDIVSIIGILFLTILCVCVIKNGAVSIDGVNLVSIFLFIVKLIIVFMVGVGVFNTLSIFGKSDRGMILTITYFIFCIVSDVLIHTDFITYTSDIAAESLFIIVNGLLYVTVLCITNINIRRKGELL